jgi:hypothetical protein
MTAQDSGLTGLSITDPLCIVGAGVLPNRGRW